MDIRPLACIWSEGIVEWKKERDTHSMCVLVDFTEI